MNKSGQTVKPNPGETVKPSDPAGAPALLIVAAIHEIAGAHVDGVNFVADYAEIIVDGAVVRLLLHPVVIAEASGEVAFPGPGSRDALCALIGRRVAEVELHRDLLLLRFDGSTVVRARIDEADERGPESVHYVPLRAGQLDLLGMETY